MDSNEIVAKVQRVKRAIEKSLPQVGTQVLGFFGDQISLVGFADGQRQILPNHRPGIPNMLQMSQGRLLQSFLVGSGKGKQDRETSIKVSGGRLSVSLDSKVPYATIQNVGGSIAPTVKMVKFFWAMYFLSGYTETRKGRKGEFSRGGIALKGMRVGKGERTESGDEFWLAMALHAKMGKSITIKPTHYIDNAKKKFDEGVNDFMLKLFTVVVQDALA